MFKEKEILSELKGINKSLKQIVILWERQNAVIKTSSQQQQQQQAISDELLKGLIGMMTPAAGKEASGDGS